MLTKNPHLTDRSRELRQNMTKEELRLWLEFLKPLPVTVHRQKVICNYIVDFYISDARLVIELDGSQHYEDEGRAADQVRDAVLRENGYTVLRYSNSDISQRFSGVCEDILQHLEGDSKAAPHPSQPRGRSAVPPSPKGEGKDGDASRGRSAVPPSPKGEGKDGSGTTPHPSSGLRETPDATFPQGGKNNKEF